MANTEDEYDFGKRYDWSTWLDGQTWRLTRGVDFTVDAAVFRSMAYRAAARRSGAVVTSIEGEAVVLQFTPHDEA